MNSFNETLDHYRALLVAQQEGRLQLPNDNLDTGTITGAAVYRLTDETYAKVLGKTSGKPLSSAMRQDLLAYYSDLEKLCNQEELKSLARPRQGTECPEINPHGRPYQSLIPQVEYRGAMSADNPEPQPGL